MTGEFGVCLVSIIGEHHKDFREFGVLTRNFISRAQLTSCGQLFRAE